VQVRHNQLDTRQDTFTERLSMIFGPKNKKNEQYCCLFEGGFFILKKNLLWCGPFPPGGSGDFHVWRIPS
jgi:hypothetical protein